MRPIAHKASGVSKPLVSLMFCLPIISCASEVPAIKTAKAKGLTARVVLYKHALKNAMIPILTTIGQTFATLLSGAAVMETVFGIPGIGQLIVSSVTKRDYPVIQGIVLVISLIYIVINLVIDLLYGIIDPRMRDVSKR